MTDITQKSRHLSFLLRHRPEAANLSLDKEGWCDLVELMANTDLTLEELLEIVRTDEKGRYSVAPADFIVPTHIRANQGHSAPGVKITFKSAVPPTVLYHGTVAGHLEDILKRGLLPMKRTHVHLSADLETARSVGGRRKGDVTLLSIDAKQALADGIKFYLSDNGVWLCHHVPPTYLKALP